jgi:hypothetical protein
MMSPDTPTVTSWVLTRPRDGHRSGLDTWTFRTYDENNIQVFRNNDAWQDDYVNGYYPTLQARDFWDEKIAEGYSKTEILSDE